MLSIKVFNAHRTRRVTASAVVRYVKRVLQTSRVKNARVSIVFVDTRYARSINRRYLNHDYSTDVISFPLESGDVLEGEVYVNLDRARTQAKAYDVSFNNEVARLVIHGALHLVGYDDSTGVKARRMRAEEDDHVHHWFR